MLKRLFQIHDIPAQWARTLLKMNRECFICWEQTAYDCNWLEKLVEEGKR